MRIRNGENTATHHTLGGLLSYVPQTYQRRASSHSAWEAESARKAQERSVDAGMLQEAVLITQHLVVSLG